MAGTYVTNSTASILSTGLTLPLDTDNAAIGDLMVAMLAFDLTATSNTSITVIPPAGWTLILRNAVGGGSAGTPTLLQLTYYKVAAVGDSVFSWSSSLSTNVPILGTILVYRYVGPTTFIDASAGPGTASGSDAINASSVVATQNNDVIMTLFSMLNSVPDDVALQAPQKIRVDLGILAMRVVTGDELRGQSEATGMRLLSSADALGLAIAQTVALRSAPYEAAAFEDNYKSKVLRGMMPKPYDARLATTLGKLLTVLGTEDNNIGGLFGVDDFLPDETV